MQMTKKLVLAGVAALALAGGAELALAQPLHVMTLRLPDGGLAQIQYTGNIPPKVTLAPEPAAAEFFGPASPFAMVDRISAQMNREMDALMSGAAWAPPPLLDPERVLAADMGNLPPGAAQYSFVSTLGGNGDYCTRSMEITRAGPGARPHVVTHSTGDCRGVGDVRFNAAPFAGRPQQERAPRVETRSWPGVQNSGPALMNVAYRPAR